MKFDAIQHSIDLAKEAELAMTGVTKPQLSPQRQRQANDALNIIRRYIREMELLQMLHAEEMKCTSADPASPFFRSDWYGDSTPTPGRAAMRGVRDE